jgi:hypothetical protein
MDEQQPDFSGYFQGSQQGDAATLEQEKALVNQLSAARPNAEGMAAPLPKPAQAAEQKKPKTYGDLLDEIPNAGDRYEAERKLNDAYRNSLFQRAEQTANTYYTPANPAWKAYLDYQKDRIERAVPKIKPIQETEAFKNASREAGLAQYNSNAFTFGMLHNQLAYAKTLKDPQEKVNFLVANVPKVIQSLATGQSDALQEAERTWLTPEFKNLLLSSGPLDVKEKLQLLNQRGFGAFFKDPDAFIKKAEQIYNAGVTQYNATHDFWHQQLGKAVSEAGLKRFDEIKPGKQMDLSDVRNRIMSLTGQDPVKVYKSPMQPPVGLGGAQMPKPSNQAPKSGIGVTRPTGVSIFPAPAAVPGVQEDFTGKNY